MPSPFHREVLEISELCSCETVKAIFFKVQYEMYLYTYIHTIFLISGNVKAFQQECRSV